MKYLKTVIIKNKNIYGWDSELEYGTATFICPKCGNEMVAEYVCKADGNNLLPKYCCYCGKKLVRGDK